MSYHVRGFQTAQELEDFLNGVLLSSLPNKDLYANASSLNGLTVVYDAGAGDVTVTFVGASLSLKQVVDQINAVTAGAASVRNYGHTAPYASFLAFVKPSLQLKGTGTANAILGLATETVTAIVQTKLIFLEQDHVSHIFWLAYTD